MRKTPLRRLLVERSIFPDEKEALGWIMAGKVCVNGRPVTKGGLGVDPEAELEVKGLRAPYVSKGGLKLAGAINLFGLSFRDAVAVDAGACTGGFTDCLLQHGAGLVYAVDTGHGQLAGRLRVDPRVVNMERTNIGDDRLSDLDPRPTAAVVDLSYLSLKKAVPIVTDILCRPKTVLALVKPLFEVADAEARRTGVIREASVYAEVLRDLLDCLPQPDLPVRGICHSPVTGNRGTREFFILMSSDPGVPLRPSRTDLLAQIERSVEAAADLKPYGK
jgi:23S rRNA (cytidine1920-2'-O)/16S rRNA (cytidine1409-2'-O)-methyltransferase